jgi:hypothetical protein
MCEKGLPVSKSKTAPENRKTGEDCVIHFTPCEEIVLGLPAIWWSGGLQ